MGIIAGLLCLLSGISVFPNCFFEQPELWKIEKNDSDGRFVYIGTTDGKGYSPIFRGMMTDIGDDDLCYWWPILDV